MRRIGKEWERTRRNSLKVKALEKTRKGKEVFFLTRSER